jgi:hypothetical protein
MAKRHFVIVGIVGIIISLCLSCSNNRLTDTEWENERGSILAFGKTSFTWTGDTTVTGTGTYTVSGDTVNLNFSRGFEGVGSLIGGSLMVTGNNITPSKFQRVR